MSELSRADVEAAHYAAKSMADHAERKLGVKVTVQYEIHTHSFKFTADYVPVSLVTAMTLEVVTATHINELNGWLTRTFNREG